MKKGTYRYLVRANEYAAIIALLTMSIVVLMEVILRYFFSITFQWSGELTIFLFIYLVFLGVPIAFREKAHVLIQFFVSFLPARVQKWLQRILDILIGVCITVVAISTVKMMTGLLGATIAPGLKIPYGFVYAAAPIGIALLLIEIVRRLVKEKQ
jgi:TRAP-type C4-dicarboxylate transport system permease small subunit